MTNIRNLLQWHFTLSGFKYTAEHLFSIDTKKVINQSLMKLDKLAQDSDGSNHPDSRRVKDIYTLFQDNYTLQYSDLNSLFSKRDVRFLVGALEYKPSDNATIILFSEQFETAKRIITDKWRDSFIINLWHILLKNWNAFQNHRAQGDSLAKLLGIKCREYNRSRKDILNISANITLFFRPNSPKEYASRLLKEGVLISEANSLINQKKTVLVYEYYSNVIEEYVEMIVRHHITRDNMESIYQFLLKQNSKKTTLIICSYLINNTKFNDYVEIIKSETVNMIADPVNKHLWNYSGLTESQKSNIETARRKLNILLNKDFIDVFFEKLVQDDRRKGYWLKFINKINDIKFVGNKANYQYLKNIESISKYVDSRYKTTKRNQSTCALIIYSQNYVFVEFTDTGALYIYKNRNFNVNLNNIASMEDLKVWPKNIFACKNNPGYSESYYYGSGDKFLIKNEGRITHQGQWELRVNRWMGEYYYD